MARLSDSSTPVVERYRIGEKLGAGGMGEVLRGVHVTLGREVAIKRLKAEVSLDESIVQRFENEARAVNLIHHENIVEVTDFYRDRLGRMHMVMELLDGQSLGDLIRSSAPLPSARAAHIGAQIADALSAAHGCGVIHRDLKPENLFLIRRRSTADYVKVLDFGIARLRPDCGGLEATQTGAIIGTPVYMSPEQAQGLTVDARTDMYSLGVILYEMVTGHWPFPRTSPVQMMMSHISDDPLALDVENLPVKFGDLISRCLEKDSEARPQSMSQVSALLDSWAQPTNPGTQRKTASSQVPAASGFSDTFIPQLATGAEEGQTQAEPGPEFCALSVEEATMSLRPSGLVLAGFAVIAVVGIGVGWAILHGAAPSPSAPAVSAAKSASSQPPDSSRSQLDHATRLLGWPPTPSTCQTTDPASIDVLVRCSEFLLGGRPERSRPKDTAALASLESLKGNLSPEVGLWRARAYLQAGQAKEAMEAARFATKSCATLAAAYATQAAAYATQAAAYATQGTAPASLEEQERAAELLHKALTLAPHYVDARFNLALSQLALEQTDAARQTLSLVLQEQPSFPDAHFLRGEIALQRGDLVAAVSDLQQVVSQQEDNAAAWYTLGFALKGTDQIAASREAYCRARVLGETRAPCPSLAK